MQFVLMGFDQEEAGVRRYVFQGVTGGTRTDFSVGVELALVHTYGIRIQDLPVLCRGLLERQAEGGDTRRWTFGENEMRVYADSRATARAEAAQKKRPPRRPAMENVGAAWRVMPR
jgi:hypothetical protein